MPQEASHTQAAASTTESRTDKVAIAVTPSEKRAVRVVAGIRGTDESNLCRTTTIEEIVREFDHVRSSMGSI